MNSPVIRSKKILRYSDEIGLHYLDRGKDSCKWATEFCNKHCYYSKFERIFPVVKGYLKRASFIWEHMTSNLFTGLKRVRLCKAGEPFSELEDVARVAQWAKDNPKTLFWAPTRAWRSPELRKLLKPGTMPVNMRIHASIDPSNTEEEVQSLVNEGWSTMFFGNDTEHPIPGNKKCPKTWKKKKEYCGKCRTGCFSASPVHVWLKQH